MGPLQIRRDDCTKGKKNKAKGRISSASARNDHFLDSGMLPSPGLLVTTSSCFFSYSLLCVLFSDSLEGCSPSS